MPTNHAANSPRRTLVAISGLSISVVTETLYALSQLSPPFIPTELQLLTSISGRELARNILLDEKSSPLKRFSEEYNLPLMQFNENNIHVISTMNGTELDDIDSKEANESAADFITQKVHEFTRDPESALHLSIAGGRKTVGIYAAYALSLFARPQDRLSHVFVDEPYLTDQNFYYPSSVPGPSGQNFQEAKVILAEIPFIRIADIVPKSTLDNMPLVTGSIRFSESIAKAQAALQPTTVSVDLPNKTVTINGVTSRWSSETYLGFFAFLLLTHLEDGLITKPMHDESNNLYKDRIIRCLESIRFNASSKAESSNPKGMEQGYFDTNLSRVKKTLQKHFEPGLAERVTPEKRARANPVYVFDIRPENIEIIGLI